MKKKVLITRAVAEKELAPLYEQYDVEMNTLDRDYTYEELTEKVKGKMLFCVCYQIELMLL